MHDYWNLLLHDIQSWLHDHFCIIIFHRIYFSSVVIILLKKGLFYFFRGVSHTEYWPIQFFLTDWVVLKHHSRKYFPVLPNVWFELVSIFISFKSSEVYFRFILFFPFVTFICSNNPSILTLILLTETPDFNPWKPLPYYSLKTWSL